jgi:hypothetical protein
MKEKKFTFRRECRHGKPNAVLSFIKDKDNIPDLNPMLLGTSSVGQNENAMLNARNGEGLFISMAIFISMSPNCRSRVVNLIRDEDSLSDGRGVEVEVGTNSASFRHSQ